MPSPDILPEVILAEGLFRAIPHSRDTSNPSSRGTRISSLFSHNNPISPSRPLSSRHSACIRRLR